jgi:hypothetical protein
VWQQSEAEVMASCLGAALAGQARAQFDLGKVSERTVVWAAICGNGSYWIFE